MSYQDILYRRDGYLAIISLNRPDRLNAWTRTMDEEVRAAIEAADQDENVRAIIITGEGRGFCAGADMTLLSAVMENDSAASNEAEEKDRGPQKSTAAADRLEQNYRHKFSYMLRVKKPIVAAINGPCAGMGLCMTLFCDVRFMADHTKLTTAFSRRGLVAEHGIAWMLPRLIGPMNAIDLLYSGRTVSAAEAEKMGLVWTRPEDGFMDTVKAWTSDLVTLSSPRSLRVMKRQIFDGLFQDLSESWETADDEMVKSFSSEDFKEGVAHFLEKRPPAFTGR